MAATITRHILVCEECFNNDKQLHNGDFEHRWFDQACAVCKRKSAYGVFVAEQKVQKVTRYKGFVIALEKDADGYEEYQCYTQDEYAMGKGFRYPEIGCSSLAEAKEFINCY